MTPDTHPFDAVYVLAQIGWTALGVLLLVAAVFACQRVERRIARRHRPSNIVTFPRRDAVVVPVHKGRGESA